ncbi:MAG: type II secretion system protein GspK [Phycisphaerales bacterium]|jgi:hypothetical protein
MMNKNLNNPIGFRKRSGIVLLVTLVLLVVLATLGYTLSTRVLAQRHRNQYIIDYSNARYGCDSALKYALATVEEIEAELISRPNEPDFSDLFYLDEAGYQELVEQWSLEFGMEMPGSGKSYNNKAGGVDDFNDGDFYEIGADFSGMNYFTIPGPYGPPWPLVTDPVEFEVGSAKVKIEIEDENAKYPLGWALLADKEIEREVEAGFETFCEMNGLKFDEIESLKSELEEIGKIKPFAVSFKTITKTVRTPTRSSIATRSGSRTRRTRQTRIRRKTVSASEQIAEQTTHFAKLFHSSMIDTETLARPTIVRSDASESPLKYLGMWGSMKVNINTAPRHVLEAAFIFGGNQVEIAEEIIQRRRIEPYENIEDLKTDLFRYSDSISKCEDYITTTSRFFTIKVTVVSGVAKTSSIIAITKDGDKVERIAVINS